ncbi:MAG: phosphoribosylanthranilate isomerase [Proteobacteria bacterium]|nr:phosphoribosylanthranilate isomerase [Pseudomonadota bacterium]
MQMKRAKIKICGLTIKEQAVEIAAFGVDALGFILYPPSPRYIEPEKIRTILVDLPPLVKTLGVFVDEPLAKVVETIRRTGLDTAQLSGAESPEYCLSLTEQGISWIKSFRVRDNLDESLLNRYPTRYFLLDAWSEKEYGGTGKTFDWNIADGIDKKYEIILAGGITVDNVDKAIRQIRPYGIDVSSGVETSPGIKSLEKVAQLMDRIRVFNAQPTLLPSSKIGR